MKRRSCVLMALVLCGAVAHVRGQYQVNNRVGPVNNQLYGGGTSSMGSIRYGGGAMLPSEARYENRKSGMMPSEIKMNANAAGPLAPNYGSVYTNPAYNPITPHSWSAQGSVHNAPPSVSRPAGVNPYLTMRGGYGR